MPLKKKAKYRSKTEPVKAAAGNQPASVITGEAVGSNGFVRSAKEKRYG